MATEPDLEIQALADVVVGVERRVRESKQQKTAFNRRVVNQLKALFVEKQGNQSPHEVTPPPLYQDYGQKARGYCLSMDDQMGAGQ